MACCAQLSWWVLHSSKSSTTHKDRLNNGKPFALERNILDVQDDTRQNCAMDTVQFPGIHLVAMTLSYKMENIRNTERLRSLA